MIKTTLQLSQIKSKLQQVNTSKDVYLKTSAGFDQTSKFAGRYRKTFSLILSQDDMDLITSQMEQLYNKVCKDIDFSPSKSEPYPFDYVRVDAFYDSAEKNLKALEINVRGAGMHEISELCDYYCAEALDENKLERLNDKIVSIQKNIQEAKLGPVNKLLYITQPNKPKWLYYDAVKRAYNDVIYVTNLKVLTAGPDGVILQDKTYTAITAKASGGLPEELWKLDKAGVISIIQPKIDRLIGMKEYLNELSFDFIASSRPLDKLNHELYIKNRRELVLKKSKSSGAKGVIVGVDASKGNWKKELEKAYTEPKEWLMQEFIPPSSGIVVGHGDLIPKNNKVLLGIFILPDISDPTTITIDISVKLYDGLGSEIIFDPADIHEDIWFGNVIVINSAV